MKSDNYSIRIRIVIACVIFAALVLVAKLYHVQIINGKEFAERANRQYERRSAPLFDRGSIFFTSKDGTRVSAATIQEGVSLAISPKDLDDAAETYERLRQFVALNKNEFMEKAAKKDDPFEELSKRLEEKTGEEIQKMKIPGVIVYRDAWRTYPAQSLAAHAVGLMGFQGTEYRGRYGLERQYDDILVRNDKGQFRNFFAEIFSGIKHTSKGESGDVVTTLEPSVQNYAEAVIADARKKWQSDEIGVIVMSPKTGDILAMAALPNFNPNDVSGEKNPKVFSNPLVESAYEMGSIIKPLTMAVGIDTGSISANTTYNDKGTITVDQKKISNYDGKARGVVPMQEVLSQSLNIGIAFIVQKTGNKNISNYFRSFGFGEFTGIDQPNETRGISRNLDGTRDIEHITMGYGQGISMSPIATTRALSVLANGGKLITPHLVNTIEHDSGIPETVEYEKPKQVLKPETTETVTKMLVEVVDKALRQGTVKMEHYSIAAKTGTAQIADPVNGGYYTDRYLHSFFGYFPAYDPQYIVFLYQVYPKNTQYASETLTNPFIDITKFLINYYEITPDR
jgi:cell division protein FtsI/penicillin-binding protein 2